MSELSSSTEGPREVRRFYTPSARSSSIQHIDPTANIELPTVAEPTALPPLAPTESQDGMAPLPLDLSSEETALETISLPNDRTQAQPSNVGRIPSQPTPSPIHSTASLVPPPGARLRGDMGGASSSSTSTDSSNRPSPSTGRSPATRPYAFTGSASTTATTLAYPRSPEMALPSLTGPTSNQTSPLNLLQHPPQPAALSAASVQSGTTMRSTTHNIFSIQSTSPSSSAPMSPLRRSYHHFDCFVEMLENPFLADVHLRTKDNKVIPAHKVVLAAVSPTFRTMLGGEQLYTEYSSGVIDVPYDYKEGGFKLVLQYIYTGTITGFEPQMAVPLLEASSYFQLDELRALAVDALCQATTEANVFERLDLALSYNCAGLREHALMLIRQYNTEVIHSAEWLSLPLDVALLLVQETVIEGELAILRRCYEWCLANRPKHVEETLTKFLKFVDFTAMTEAEVSVAESMQCVPVAILYDAFKRHVLGLSSGHIPRNGGIVLQWEMKADQTDVEVVNNHVTKISSDYIPKTVCAINKFSNGRHYWTVKVMDLRLPHDSFVGVMFRPHHNGRTTGGAVFGSTGDGSPASYASSPNSPNTETYVFEPCCMTVRAPEECEITKEPAASASILIDRWCEVGVMLDFGDNCIQWFNHRSKALLFTLRYPNGAPLPSPLYPCVTLTHKSNGGAMLSECTTYPAQRPARGGFVGPTSVTPIKNGARTGTSHHHGGIGSRSSHNSTSHNTLLGSRGLASVPTPPSRTTGGSGDVFVSAGTM